MIPPRVVALGLAFLAADAAVAAAQVGSLEPPGGRWRVFTIRDAIDGTDLTQACVASLTSDALLCIQSRDGRVSGAVFSVSTSQIVCTDFSPSCRVRYRFDDARPATMTVQPQNGRASVAQPAALAARLATANLLMVELPIYRQGATSVTFDVRGYRLPATP